MVKKMVKKIGQILLTGIGFPIGYSVLGNIAGLCVVCDTIFTDEDYCDGPMLHGLVNLLDGFTLKHRK